MLPHPYSLHFARTILAGLILAGGIALVQPSAAQAAVDGEGIAASPFSVNQSLDAGGNFTGELTIINPGNTEYNFRLSAEPFSVSGEDYQHVFELKPQTTDSSKWFSFPTTTYHLNPDQHLKVPYRIHVPADASPGGHYATVFAETLTDKRSQQGVSSHKRVGIIFYLTVNGQLNKSGKVASFEAPFWQIEPPLKTVVRMENVGNTHYDAEVKVTVADLFGRAKANLTSTRTVLPHTIRRFDMDWQTAPEFGLFKVTGTAKIFDRNQALPTRYVLLIGAPYLFMMLAGAIILIALPIITKRRSKGRDQRA